MEQQQVRPHFVKPHILTNEVSLSAGKDTGAFITGLGYQYQAQVVCMPPMSKLLPTEYYLQASEQHSQGSEEVYHY
jgi:hypothetical protein